MAELRRYRNIVRWWWLVLLSTVIAAGASYYISDQQPRIYASTTTLMVGQAIAKANPSDQDLYLADQLANVYAQMAEREPILQATIDALALDVEWDVLGGQVSAFHPSQSQFLSVTVQDTSPERAAVIADEIARQLILQSPTSPQNKARQERAGFVQAQLDDLERRIQDAQAEVKKLEAELETAFSARQIRDLQSDIASWQSLINEWQRTYTNLLDFLQGGDSPNYLSVVEPAVVPDTPISPNIPQNVMLAAATGFLLALGAAFMLEYIDSTIKTSDDLSPSLGLTPLGSIARIKGKGYADRLVTLHNPFSAASEAYRVLRSNIQFMAGEQPPKTIMLTSTTPEEGKSLTAANLSVVMAQADFKTILVDADLRKPSIHKIFEISNSQGLSDLISNPDMEPEAVLQDTTVKNLRVLTSGPLPPNPAEKLSSQRMSQLVHLLEETADVVIFDTTPVMAVTDAAVLANRVDGVILVIRSGRIPRATLKKAVARLKQIRANILGAIVNQTPGKGDGYAEYFTPLAQIQTETAKRPWWKPSFLR
ncbi:MAG: polysaccharide biosynthesis tyrosine autokinase [Chloroflexi bacterium]|nr:MAG: polysaccharide biosynthesis tyrosine autokinase [Chloroflexota bacterium]